MKLKLTGILLLCAVIVSAGVHVNEVSGPVKDAGALEIVTEQPVPVVTFAAKELQTYLKQATGQTVPVVQKASGGKTALVLGDCPSARAAGLDVTKLPDEGFRILRKGNCVFIAGQDDPKSDPGKTGPQYYRRATLSAVYDFLERFAGAGFFFPGRYGTVVPEKKGLFLPEKINVIESPDMVQRRYYSGRAKTYDQKLPMQRILAMESQRLRLSETNIYICHGLYFLNLVERFSKTHPEYFSMRADGSRYSTSKHTQLCYSSGIREEIYQDAKAYFTGKPASSRGIKSWNSMVASGKYFCVMPHDGMRWCQCEKCRQICGPGKQTTPEGRQAISNFMFRFTSEIAERLTKEGVEGIITQDIYSPYNRVPDFRLAKNVRVQASVNGTVNDKRKDDDRMIRDWNEKTGAKVLCWTYAMGKHMSKSIPDLPQMMPRTAAKFIRTYRDYLDGVFWEAETDRYLFNYLNYYVAAKLMWNTSLDAEKVLDSHYRLMFGKGAPMVKEVFDGLENCWVNEVIDHTVMDDLGPRVQIPGDQELWTKIYSAEKLARFEKLFDQAQRASASDKGAVERIRFIRKQILDPLLGVQRKFQASQDSLDSWHAYCPDSIWLRPFKGEVNEVNTRVDIAGENDALVFRFDCEEPEMSRLAARYSGRDNPDIWRDSDVEIFINPSGDRKHYYHFVVNANGSLTDYRRELNKAKPDIAWNSSATAKAEKGAAGWKAEVRIPLKDLGPLAKEIPVNFARCRVLTGDPAVKMADYQWSPQPGARMGGFHAIDKWGTLILEKEPEKLIPNGDFSKMTTALKNYQEWKRPWPKNGQEAKLDNRVFISGGQSLYYRNVKGKILNAGFKLPEIKPKTRYRLSYYVRTRNLNGKGGAGATISFLGGKGTRDLPRAKVNGTRPWHRLTFEFTSPDEIDMSQIDKKGLPSIGLWVWFAEGEVWFDKVELTELK